MELRRLIWRNVLKVRETKTPSESIERLVLSPEAPPGLPASRGPVTVCRRKADDYEAEEEKLTVGVSDPQ
eukprot:768765-Hanusia_phi.AAC.1